MIITEKDVYSASCHSFYDEKHSFEVRVAEFDSSEAKKHLLYFNPNEVYYSVAVTPDWDTDIDMQDYGIGAYSEHDHPLTLKEVDQWIDGFWLYEAKNIVEYCDEIA